MTKKRFNTQHTFRFKNHEQVIKNYGSINRNQKTLVVLLITIFAVLVSFSGSAIGDTKDSALKEAYMVIADGSKSKVEAEEKLEAYLKKGYPQHTGYEQTDKYPKLMVSDRIKGLNPGFWIVVAAIADDKEVAGTLSQFIRSLGQASYVRQVWVERPEEVKLLILNFEKMLYQCSETEYQIPNHEWCKTEYQLAELSIIKNLWGFEVMQYCDENRFKCEGIDKKSFLLHGGSIRSKSAIQQDKHTVILPYVCKEDYGIDLSFYPKPKQDYLDCSIRFPNQTTKHRPDSSDFAPNQKILRFKKFSLKCFSR